MNFIFAIESCGQGGDILFFLVIFCAFFATMPQKTRAIRSSAKAALGCPASGTLHAHPIPYTFGAGAFSPMAALKTLHRILCVHHVQKSG
jgi:hypothetical protein